MLKREARQAVDDGVVEPLAQRGRPTGDHEAKRAELLRAATAVIAEEGYVNASLRKVAQRAGYTTGAVTYYFANKKELVIALAESRFDRYDAMLAEVDTNLEDIKAHIEHWLRLSTGDPGFPPVMSELLARGRHEPDLGDVIRRRYAHYRDVYTAILASGQERGLIRDDIRADLLADQLSAMGDGWALLFPLEPERFTPSRVGELVDAAFALIAAPPSVA
ncbi:hypothetical protein GCM10023094_13190 [Rhodococcus olei]|uniref:HTH tetR-type domain-containing protein n=1 Tax=Rhodococcus olei TaxID=2161675 RepID=A0ABP8NZ84_9NOCA